MLHISAQVPLLEVERCFFFSIQRKMCVLITAFLTFKRNKSSFYLRIQQKQNMQLRVNVTNFSFCVGSFIRQSFSLNLTVISRAGHIRQIKINVVREQQSVLNGD